MNPLSFSLERGILICARPETVFSFFTDSALFSSWWGPGSTIQGRPGGAIVIRYPNGDVARGNVVELNAPSRIVFTYGYDDVKKPIAPGGSRVTITLETRPGGTWVQLRHDVDSQQIADTHVQGWKYQLALFSNVATKAQLGDVDDRLDRYFAAWRETDAAKRVYALRDVATEDLIFRDPFGTSVGIDELDLAIAAVHKFMPGVSPRRDGAVRLCHGTALVAWNAVAPDGKVVAHGTNSVDFAPDGRLARVTGFWDS